MKRILCVFGLFFALCAGAARVSAQSSASSLHGEVTDPQGAVVPGASVVLSDPATGFSRNATTDGDGSYQFLQVPPATYTVTVTAEGFNVATRNAVHLMVSTPATLNFTLQLKSASTQVEVSASEPLVNTQDATLGHAFGQSQIQSLPLEARDPTGILSLQAGVVFIGNGGIDTAVDSRSGAVSGARSDQTNVTIDGIDDNDQIGGFAFRGALRTTLDSLQEFRVTTTNSNADAGRSSGAQITLVTKSGTNDFHGSLYEYHRPTITTANDYFIKRSQLDAGLPNVPGKLIRNTFGAAAGGPIIKNKLFFFATYEGQRTRENTVVTRSVPTESMRQGYIKYQYCTVAISPCPTNALAVQTLSPTDLANLDPNCSTPSPGFSNGTCPLGAGPDPAVMAEFQKYPLPNSTTRGDGLNIGGYTFSAPAPSKLDTYIAKVDYNITSNGNHKLFVRANLQNDHVAGTENNGPEFPGDKPNILNLSNNKGISVGYTAVLTNNLINNFRYGFIRQGFDSLGLQTNHYVGFRVIDQLNGNSPTTRTIIPVHNLIDDVAWSKGKHTFGFGGNLRFIDDIPDSNSNTYFFTDTNVSILAAGAIAGTGSSLDPGANQFQSYGFPAVDKGFATSYDSAVGALVGILPEVTANYNLDKNLNLQPEGKSIKRHFRSHELEFYAQDSWRVTPTFSFTFGARYTLLQPPYEINGEQVAPTMSLSDYFNKRNQAMMQGSSYDPLISFAPSGQANGKPPIWAWDYKDIAPRVAFAWSPNPKSEGLWKNLVGPSGKTSIRAGYGIYYDHFGEGIVNSFNRNGSFGLTTSITNPAGLLTVDDSPRYSGPNNIPAFASGGCSTPPCPLIAPPPTGPFPLTPPVGNFAITWGLDDKLKTPYSHVVNLSVERELPHNFVVEASYVGRFAHRLLQESDMAMPLDIRDPKSGMDYFTAASLLTQAMNAGTNIQDLAPIPFFQNIFPQAAGPGKLSNCAPGVAPANPTATQNMYDMFSCNPNYATQSLFSADVKCVPACATINGVTAPYQFWSQQYASLYAWRSIGNSSYNGGQFSLRHHSGGLTMDFNYTFSKSLDIGSNAERINQYEGAGFASQIINAWSPKQLRAPSDFDLRHQINANWVYELPFGRGQRFGSSVHGVWDALLSGWNFSGLFRMTSGFAVTVEPGTGWPTNYELTSAAVPVGPLPKTGVYDYNGAVNLFQNPAAAINSFTFALPGQSGVRNNLRGPGYRGADLGLSKIWKIKEAASLKFSAQVFNVTNTPIFDVGTLQPNGGNNSNGNLSFTNSGSFGQFVSTLSKPRVMEFGLRLSF